MVDSREGKENDEDDTGCNGWLVAIEVVGIHLGLLKQSGRGVLRISTVLGDNYMRVESCFSHTKPSISVTARSHYT